MVNKTLMLKSLYVSYAKRIEEFSASITSALSVGKQKDPIYVLDGVRAIACLSVISFHLDVYALFAHIWSPILNDFGATVISALGLAGEMGIILFFILSGFLLFLPFARAILFDQAFPPLRRYYIRRIFRILPGYYVALLLMALYIQPAYFQAAHLNELWLFLTFRMDFPITYQQLNPPFWTLAIEFQFYLVLPLIAWIIGKVVGKGGLNIRVVKIVACVSAILAWGLYTRYWGFSPNSGVSIQDLTPLETFVNALRPYTFGTSGKYYEIFAVGMLIAIAYLCLQNAPAEGKTNRWVRQLSPWLFVLGMVTIAWANLWHYYVVYVHGITLHYLDPYQSILTQYKDMLNPICFAVGYGLCLFAILHGPASLKRPFEWLPLRWIGWMSYSLYIWHDPFVIYFQAYFLPKFQALNWSQGAQYSVYAFWVVITAFPLAIIFYRWIEMPGIRLGEMLCRLLAGPGRNTEHVIVPIPKLQEAVLVTSRARESSGDVKP